MLRVTSFFQQLAISMLQRSPVFSRIPQKLQWQLTASIISTPEFHLVEKNDLALKIPKVRISILKALNIWFKNYQALISFMSCRLTFTFPFRPRDRYEYHGMNNRLYVNFWSVNKMKQINCNKCHKWRYIS